MSADKERAILFSAPMIKQLLAGTKTQTRRLVKPQPEFRGNGWTAPGTGDLLWGDLGNVLPHGPNSSPYHLGKVWVRETWRVEQGYHPARPPLEKKLSIQYAATPQPKCRGRIVDEPAEGFILKSPCQGALGDDDGVWRSPLFMPRWASRITLEITSIRVERLTSISEEDAKAEGAVAAFIEEAEREPGLKVREAPYSVECFRQLWNSINGKKKGCTWADSPWVWRLEFRVIP